MTTIHCPACSGVTHLDGENVRWCECGGAPGQDPKDAKIARLRALVEEAYDDGGRDGHNCMHSWNNSYVKKAMESL
jgi:hypothetical protein